MKHLFLTLCIAAFHFSLLAQKPIEQGKRVIGYFKNDSINVNYNEDYYLAEYRCAEIIRKGHYDTGTRKFKGPFEDVSKADPAQVVAVGSYDKNGLKQGNFRTWHLNGKLQARGSFKDNSFVDTWDFYYSTGKPKITFELMGMEIKIINAWNEDGKKTVDNGKGTYELIIGPITWKGKINDGRPDGKWKAARSFFKQNEVLATEIFKDGVFQQGSNAGGVYKDSSNIHLFPADFFPLTRADYLIASNVDCDAMNIIAANYPGGAQKFITDVGERFTPVLNQLNLGPFIEPLALQVKILEDGRLTFDPANGTDPKMVSAFKAALNGLPNFKPATVNGKAVQQDIIISINYNSSVYSFSYRHLPVSVK